MCVCTYILHARIINESVLFEPELQREPLDAQVFIMVF